MSDHKTSPGCSLVIASVVALEGALIVPISLNVIPVDPATFHAPRLVAATAGVAFLLMGGWFVAAFGVLAALGTVYYAVLRGRPLLGGEDTRKPAPAELPDSGSDRKEQA